MVKLNVTQSTFDEIANALREADYHHTFLRDGAIDMTGIAIERDPVRTMPPHMVEVDPRGINRDRFREIYGLDNLGNDNRET
ncbi:hypothetical protein [Bradyrhizobium japonicum]|uniref:hypothetical protein n=1 Tax=Bradyrhizobium japonicum TaxID=375 RepID=UPI000576D511|nr:hypothetical protein [Bradyrhizobium japonicum]